MGTDTLHIVNKSETVLWKLIYLQYVKCWDSEKYNIYTFKKLDTEQNQKDVKHIFIHFFLFPHYIHLLDIMVYFLMH